MKKIIKITSFTLLGFILFAAIAAVSVILLVDPNDYRDKISATISDSIDRKANISGEVKWRFAPLLTIEVNDVTIENPANFSERTFLQIKHINLQPKLGKLLFGKVNINKIIINQMHLKLITNKQNKNNWQDLSKDKQADKANTKSSDALNVKNIEVKNSIIEWNNQAQGQQFKLTKLSLSLKGITTNGSFPAKASFNLVNDKLKQTVKINFAGNVGLYLAKNQITFNDYNVKIDNGSVSGSLKITDINTTPSYSGNTKVTNLNVTALMASFDQALPKMRSNSALTSVSLETTMSSSQGKIKSFSAKNLKLDKTNIGGDIEYANNHLRFNVNANAMNLDDYAATRTIRKTSHGTQTTLAYPFLQNLNANGQFTVKELITAKQTLSNVKGKVKANNGTVNITPLTANIYRGTANGSVTLNTRRAPAQMIINTSLNDIQLSSILHSNNMTGTGNIKANLIANPAAFTQTLNGSMYVNFNNGTIKGLNLLSGVNKAVSFYKRKGVHAKTTNDTEFSTLTASIKINNGVLKNNDLKIDSPVLNVTGRGTANLNNEKINYYLLVTMKDSFITKPILQLQGIGDGIPLKISGTFGNYRVEPDLVAIGAGLTKSLLRKGTGTVLESGKAAGKSLKKGGETIKDVFEGILP